MDTISIGIDLAHDSVAQRQREDRVSAREAARALLAEGLADWGWPAGLSAESLQSVQAAVAAELATLAR